MSKVKRIRIPFSIGDVLAYRLPSGGFAIAQVYAWGDLQVGEPDGGITQLDAGYVPAAPIIAVFGAPPISCTEDPKVGLMFDRGDVIEVLGRDISAWEFVIPGPAKAWNDGDWFHLGNFDIYRKLRIPDIVVGATHSKERVMIANPYSGNIYHIDGPVEKREYRGAGVVTIAWLKSTIQIVYGDLDPSTKLDLEANPDGYRNGFVLE